MIKIPENKKEVSDLVSQLFGEDITAYNSYGTDLLKVFKSARLKSAYSNIPLKHNELFLEDLISNLVKHSDLTFQEISQYIELAEERVFLQMNKEAYSNMSKILEDSLSEDDKLKYTLIEAIDKQIQNRDKIIQRIVRLYNEIEGKMYQKNKIRSSEGITPKPKSSLKSILENLEKEIKNLKDILQ